MDKVVVSTGQAVREGDVLYTIEKHTLDQMIAEEQRSECCQQADTADEIRKRWDFHFL